MDISVLILTKNEEDIIDDCLKQITFANEIIILDQDSNDNTVKLAKKYTSKIYTSHIADFAKNRDTLASFARNEWILYLDADERVTEGVLEEIKEIVKNPSFDAYYFNRKNYILGILTRHGGWWPDPAPRLFKKSRLQNWYGNVHETPIVKGEMGFAKNPIIHLTARNMNLMLEKTIKWAKIEADMAYQHKHPQVNALKVIKAMVFEFFFRYIKKLGALDGKVGLIEAIFQALHKAIFLTYLWELQNNTQLKFKSINYE